MAKTRTRKVTAEAVALAACEALLKTAGKPDRAPQLSRALTLAAFAVRMKK